MRQVRDARFPVQALTPALPVGFAVGNGVGARRAEGAQSGSAIVARTGQ